MMKVFETLKKVLSTGKHHKDNFKGNCKSISQYGQVSKPYGKAAEANPAYSAASTQMNERERIFKEYLAAIIKRCTPYIDTCELLHEKFPVLMGNMTPFLREYGKKLMIPSGVETELKNLFYKRPELQGQIMNVLILIKQKKEEGLIASCGRDGVTFADQQMLSIATGSLLSDEALFITRDHSLSEDILKLNELGSVHGKKVTVNRISKYGYLAKYTPASEREPKLTHAKLSA